MPELQFHKLDRANIIRRDAIGEIALGFYIRSYAVEFYESSGTDLFTIPDAELRQRMLEGSFEVHRAPRGLSRADYKGTRTFAARYRSGEFNERLAIETVFVGIAEDGNARLLGFYLNAELDPVTRNILPATSKTALVTEFLVHHQDWGADDDPSQQKTFAASGKPLLAALLEDMKKEGFENIVLRGGWVSAEIDPLTIFKVLYLGEHHSDKRAGDAFGAIFKKTGEPYMFFIASVKDALEIVKGEKTWRPEPAPPGAKPPNHDC